MLDISLCKHPHELVLPERSFPALTVASLPHSHKQFHATAVPRKTPMVLFSALETTVKRPNFWPDRSIKFGISTFAISLEKSNTTEYSLTQGRL